MPRLKRPLTPAQKEMKAIPASSSPIAKIGKLVEIYRKSTSASDKMDAATFLAVQFSVLGRMRSATKMTAKARHWAADNYDGLCGIALMEGMFIK